jgi:uncharacterized protein YxeA
MKKIFIVLLAVLLSILIGISFWFLNNLDHLAKNAIIKYGSEMTEAKVNVSAVHIDIKDGAGNISKLTIGNPKGFKTAYAMDIKSFAIQIDPLSLTKDVVLIKKINIDSPNIIYEKNEVTTNFDALQKNITQFIKSKEDKDNNEKNDKSDTDKKDDKKFIIDEFTIKNAKVEASSSFMNGKTISFNLPNITLTNIGKSKGGITSAEFGLEVTEKIKSNLISSFNFNELTKAIKNSAEEIKDSVKKIKGETLNSLKKLF